MKIEIHVHHHKAPKRNSKLEAKVDVVLQQLGVVMSKIDEMRAELVAINEATNELAADVADLIARVQGGLSEAEANEVVAELTSVKERLQGVAAEHTPDNPVDSPADPLNS